jgi:hypothetical protein
MAHVSGFPLQKHRVAGRKLFLTCLLRYVNPIILVGFKISLSPPLAMHGLGEWKRKFHASWSFLSNYGVAPSRNIPRDGATSYLWS